MEWNNGLERKKFEARLKKQRKEYFSLGMSEEQIREIELYDWAEFKSRRRYAMHTQSLQVSEFDADSDESDNSLLHCFCEELTVFMELPVMNAKYKWVDELSNQKYRERIMDLSDSDFTLLTKYVDEGLNQYQLASLYGISQKNIHKKLIRIKEYICASIQN